MKIFLIDKWIMDNEPLFNINLGDEESDSLEKVKLENPIFKGQNNNGYYYLSNGYRIGISDSLVDEIGIDFLQSDSNIMLNDNYGMINLTNSKIHEVLNYFNDRFISWEPISTKDNSALVIKIICKNIYFIFDIYKGTLEKISKSNIDVPPLCEE